MQDRKYYEEQFSQYPDVVTKTQLMAMLGGICEKTAQGLLQSNKIEHFRINGRYHIPKVCVIDFMMQDDYERFKERIEYAHCNMIQDKVERGKADCSFTPLRLLFRGRTTLLGSAAIFSSGGIGGEQKMSKIKTRETVKNVKAIDKAAVAGERMKNAFIRSKNSTENLMDDRQVTPGEYAEDKVLYAAEDISRDAAHLAGSGVRMTANKGKEAFQRHRAEKAAEKLREHSSAAEPPTSEQPSPSEHWQTPSNRQTNTPNVSPAEQPTATNTEQPLTPQTRPGRQGYQPVSTGDSGTTLYSDADRMVEQGRELAKKKAKQKAEVGRQIKQQTDKIAHQPERTVKTTDASSGLRHAGETVQAADRPAQFIGKSVRITDKSVQGVKPSAHRVEQTARTTKQTIQTARRTSGAVKQSVRTVEQSARTIKHTAKSTGKATAKTAKGTIKTSQRAVKTAQQTSKAAIKTAQATAKTTQKTTQATAKAARTAAAAAKAAAKAAIVTAKAVAKATTAAVKAIIAGVKALIAAITAGGWVAVLVIVIICLIALIVGSCFGIFFSSEDTGSDQTMYEVVREINTDYDNQLESIKQSYVYDDLEMYGSRAVWKEVLAVYAVKTTTDPNNAQEVASMDDSKRLF